MKINSRVNSQIKMHTCKSRHIKGVLPLFGGCGETDRIVLRMTDSDAELNARSQSPLFFSVLF